MKLKLYSTENIIKCHSGIYAVRILLIAFISLFTYQSNAQTITGVTSTKAKFCVGTSATILFKVTNGAGSVNHFTTSTKYILYYSNGGSFKQAVTFTLPIAPVNVDGASRNMSYSVTIPLTFITGTAYRISIGSTSPNIDGSTGSNASGYFTISNPKARMDKRYPVSQCGNGADGEIIIDTALSKGVQPFKISSNGIVNTTSKKYLFNNLVPGNYHVIATDAAGCTAFDSTIVISSAVPMVVSTSHIGEVSSCGGNDGNLTTRIIGGIEPIQVSLDGINYQSPGNYVINNLKSDTNYRVTVKDFRGCTAISSPIILKGPSPIVVGTNNVVGESVCGISDGSISVKVKSGAVTPVMYNLNATPPGSLSRPNQSSNFFNNLPAGEYIVGVYDNKGCSGSVSVTVPKNPALSASYYNINKVKTCNGTEGSITARAIGGSSPFMYSLSGPVNYSFQGSNSFLNLPVGTYTETVKDSRNCEATTTIEISGPSCSGREANLSDQSQSLSGKMRENVLKVWVLQNPTPSGFTLNLQSLNNDKVSIMVSDMYGKIVYKNIGSSNKTYSFGNDLLSGIYFVQVSQGSQKQTLKLVKAN